MNDTRRVQAWLPSGCKRCHQSSWEHDRVGPCLHPPPPRCPPYMTAPATFADMCFRPHGRSPAPSPIRNARPSALRLLTPPLLGHTQLPTLPFTWCRYVSKLRLAEPTDQGTRASAGYATASYGRRASRKLTSKPARGRQFRLCQRDS